MTEQVQSAEERVWVEDRVLGVLEEVTAADGYVMLGYEGAREAFAALIRAEIAFVDTAELAQLRSDLDAAMRFVDAWPSGGVSGLMWKRFAELVPALDRWQQGQEVGA